MDTNAAATLEPPVSTATITNTSLKATTTKLTTIASTTNNNINMDEDALNEKNNLINLEQEVKNNKVRKSTRKSVLNNNTSTSKQNNFEYNNNAAKTKNNSESEQVDYKYSEMRKSSDSDFEPEEMNIRKVINNSKQSKSQKPTVNLIENNPKKYDNHYKYLINELISLLVKPSNKCESNNNNKQLNDTNSKEKLNEIINKCDSGGPNFLRDLFKRINKDSSIFSTLTNTIQELSEIVCKVYEIEFKKA